MVGSCDDGLGWEKKQKRRRGLKERLGCGGNRGGADEGFNTEGTEDTEKTEKKRIIVEVGRGAENAEEEGREGHGERGPGWGQ
jgi:hypothetical protein